MMQVLLVLAVGSLILYISEQLWRAGWARGETGRKLAHGVLGLWIAVWPWLISNRTIFYIALAFAVIVAGLKYFHSLIVDIVKAVDNQLKGWPLRAPVVSLLSTFGLNSTLDVGRKTWGEVLYALGMAASALCFSNKWIFFTVMLHLAVADSAASLAGRRWGKSNCYSFFGQRKSVAGNLAYAVTSGLILSGLTLLPLSFGGPLFSPLVLIPLVLVGTVVEGLSIFGLDNLTIPLVTGYMLLLVMQ